MGIVLVNSEGKIVKINPRAEKKFRYDKDELIGKKIETLIPKRYNKHEAHREKYNHDPKAREMGAQMNLFGLRKDGTEFPLEVSLSPYTTSKGDFVISFIVDITERKQREAQIRKSREELESSYEVLRESEESYRNLFENQLAPMFTTDTKTSKILMVNDVGVQLFGYKTKEDFLNHFNPLDHFVNPDEREKNITGAKDTGALTKIQEMKKVDGTHFWAKIYIKLSSRKKIAQTIVIDITEQVKAQELLTAKVQELEKMNKELETFTFISSHDLQEPLRKIQNFVTVLLKNEKAQLSVEGQDYLESAFKSANRMQMLIEDLLAYLRVKNADRKFEKVDLIKIAHEVIAHFKEDIAKKKAIVKIEGLCKLNIIPFQFRQLFQNFISNALKFSDPKRQLHITIKSETKVGSELDNTNLLPEKKYCHITFSDTGIGFDPEFKDRIFVVFQRLHPVEKYKGSGIGLAICKRIVENHNGIITATGELNKGASFDIYIPVV
jgi:PAS domain S-box-containing protein